MDTASLSMREVAERLLVASRTSSDPNANEAVAVCEMLRISLIRFTGADGFASLMRRALVLASAQAPSLQGVKIGPDGRLEGLEKVNGDAAVGLAAHLLELLVTFIGEPFTQRLVRDAWPDASVDKL